MDDIDQSVYMHIINKRQNGSNQTDLLRQNDNDYKEVLTAARIFEAVIICHNFIHNHINMTYQLRTYILSVTKQTPIYLLFNLTHRLS